MSRDDPSSLQNSLFPEAVGAVIYEQPLSERVRMFLRLEHLFQLVSENIELDSEWAHRAALTGMIDISDILSRSDLKAELIKELDRQAVVLGGLSSNPGVDEGRLESILETMRKVVEKLRCSASQPGQTLRRDELVASIRQRISIPGGTCNFDLPSFHHWLAKATHQRKAQLRNWFSDLQFLNESLDLALGIIRESAAPTREVAQAGFFQQPLDTSAICHLLRVCLSEQLDCFPEISAGRHRFTIRFLEQLSTDKRPTQTDRDIEFDLERCII